MISTDSTLVSIYIYLLSSSGSMGRRPVGVQRLHRIHGPETRWSPMLALDFFRIFSLRTEYLHPSVQPSHFSLKESSRLRTGSDIHYLVVSKAAMPPTFASCFRVPAEPVHLA